MALRVGRLWGSCARNLFGDFGMEFRTAVRQMGHIAIQKKGERRGCAAALTAEAHERWPRHWVPRDFLEQMKYPQFASRAHEPGEIQRQILARGVADGANGYGANVPSPSFFQHFEALHFDGVSEHAQTSLFPGRQDEMIRGTKLLHSSCATLARPLQQYFVTADGAALFLGPHAPRGHDFRREMLGLERPRQSSGYTDVHRLCHHHFECGLTSSLGPYAGQYDSDLRAIDLCHVGRAGGPSGATESTHPAPQRELSIDGAEIGVVLTGVG